MNQPRLSIFRCFGLLGAALLVAAMASCASSPSKTDTTRPALATATTRPTIRVKAGLDDYFTDSKGIIWAPDSGSDGGSEVDRPDLVITGTDRPELYHSEHYSMNFYNFKVPNGKYLLNLHFSEDFDGIADATGRLFTYEVLDGDATTGKTIKEVKDFSPWKASGAQFKAYVDSVPVMVTSGQITIAFTPQNENPQINAIEIIPQ